MSDNWYYAVGSERMGPVDDGELWRLVTAGTVTPDSWVWRNGMAEWKSADEALPASLRPAHWDGGRPEAPPEPEISPAHGGPLPAASEPVRARAGFQDQGHRRSHHPTGFQESVRAVFSKYATFSGRARRPEYWWFALFSVIGSFITAFVDAAVFGGDVGVLNPIWSLGLLVPSLAVGVRRLHDTGRTGWWLLIGLIPLIGLIVLIVFLVSAGDDTDNEYGPA